MRKVINNIKSVCNKFKRKVKKNKKLILGLLITFVCIVLVHLLVLFFALKPSIYLVGSDYYIGLGEEYKEPGYSAKYFGKDLTKDVKVSGNVNNTKVGKYIVSYSVKNKWNLRESVVYRTVHVIDKDKPVIELDGFDIVTLYVGEEYKEPGYKAYDEVDGDITDKVVVTHNLEDKIGTYEVTYTVKDSYNNSTVVKRTVKVKAKPSSGIWNSTLPVGTRPTVTNTKGSQEMVDLAIKELGNVGGEPYWRWYGYTDRIEWCVAFIDYLGDQLGYVDDVIPKTASVPFMVRWFKAMGQFQEKSYTPKPGEIIFIDWNPDGHPDHVGIVEKVENGKVYTIEGNAQDVVKRKEYSITSKWIYGYGTPLY